MWPFSRESLTVPLILVVICASVQAAYVGLCGPNEVWDPCPAKCFEQDCAVKNGRPSFCYTAQNSDCRPKCVCKPNYYRNGALGGPCVTYNECPTCGPNEVYTSCVGSSCLPDSCENIGYPIACPELTYCSGGCVCAEGFVKNKDGVCIDQKTCPSCKGDPNAVSGCGNHCSDNCYYRNQTVDCTTPGKSYCPHNGCDCKEGFFYNAETKKCVKPDECPV